MFPLLCKYHQKYKLHTKQLHKTILLRKHQQILLQCSYKIIPSLVNLYAAFNVWIYPSLFKPMLTCFTISYKQKLYCQCFIHCSFTIICLKQKCAVFSYKLHLPSLSRHISGFDILHRFSTSVLL